MFTPSAIMDSPIPKPRKDNSINPSSSNQLLIPPNEQSFPLIVISSSPCSPSPSSTYLPKVQPNRSPFWKFF